MPPTESPTTELHATEAAPSFDSFDLAPALLRAVEQRGYREPTPVQAAAVPAILRGADVLGHAPTGSGKTMAFALPILQAVQASRRDAPLRVQALVLVPTRELAAQVGAVLRDLAGAVIVPQRLKIAVVFGGVSINPQMMALRGGADVVVATPGRLLDLVDSNAVQLGAVRTLVLDEADRLLDLGFADELQRVLALLPARRQNLFFSATFPPAVQALADGLLREPVRVEVVGSPETAPDITQRAITVDTNRRTQLLKHLLQTHDANEWPRVLVFVAGKYAAELVAYKLSGAGIAAAPFHGAFSQGARTDTLDDFKAGALRVLVATDVAARGIHIDRLPVVVNYDLPRSPADYTHRIGRTGRAGQSGVAISFVSASTEAHFRLIEKRQGLRVTREQIEGFVPTETAPSDLGQGVGGIKGRRKSKKDKLREAAAAQQAAGGSGDEGGAKAK